MVLVSRSFAIYRTLAVLFTILALCTGSTEPVFAAGSSAGESLAPGIASQDLSLNFGDFTARGQVDYPATATGPLPALVLIPGSGTEDMNADILDPATHHVLSHIFLDITNAVVPQGYAVVRYNKHYVVSATQADTRAFHTKLTLQQMLVDAGTVLAAAESNPHIDPHSIFLYGWSEGSTVAAALAVQHPELAGLIVQGAVTEPWLQLFHYQITDVGVPYLRQFAPDGNMTLHTVQQAIAGPGGLVAEEGALFMRNLDAQGAGNGLNPFFDPTHTGVINIDKQFLPKLNAFLQVLLGPRGPLGIYAADRALPDVTQQAPQLHLPVLILQGENDANVPPSGATVLYNALTGTTDKTLKLFPGLGHSLGPASSKIMDDFAPIAQAPLQTLITWLNSHRLPSVPPTGAGGGTTWPRSELLLLGSLAFFSLGLTKLVHRNHAAVTAKVSSPFSSR